MSKKSKVLSGLNTQTGSPGIGVMVFPANMSGKGYIYNPALESDQGTLRSENLYVSQVSSSPNVIENNTTFVIYPGGSAAFPAGSDKSVYVSAYSPNHKFTAFYYADDTNYPPLPVPGNFPPSKYTTMSSVIPSYLYKQYDDDDDLQSLVSSYNFMAQNFIDTVNELNLPIYTGENIYGLLLDWVGAGIYGIPRPTLSSFDRKLIGPFNTYQFNTLAFNDFISIGPANIAVANDDTYKRILTWAILKGDGKVCSIRWLKRRIMRFLIGKNGTNPNIDQTYQISITFGPDYEMAIKFINQVTRPIFGAGFNQFRFNTARFNELDLQIIPLTPLPYREIFKEAVAVGAVEMPFQFSINVIL